MRKDKWTNEQRVSLQGTETLGTIISITYDSDTMKQISMLVLWDYNQNASVEYPADTLKIVAEYVDAPNLPAWMLPNGDTLTVSSKE